MGAQIELNTMLRLSQKDLDPTTLVVGKSYRSFKKNLRIYPIDIAILLLKEDWTALGYCAVTRTVAEKEQIEVTFKVLSLFTKKEQELITAKMLEGLRECGYLK